jgi:hypothetical protein
VVGFLTHSSRCCHRVERMLSIKATLFMVVQNSRSLPAYDRILEMAVPPLTEISSEFRQTVSMFLYAGRLVDSMAMFPDAASELTSYGR